MQIADRFTAAAWIFNWDGVFINTEVLKAWTYGLGIHEACTTLGEPLPVEIEADFPARPVSAEHPLVRRCGRWVGTSREEYAGGLVADYGLTELLDALVRHWQLTAPERIDRMEVERLHIAPPPDGPYEPWEILYELRRPHYDRRKAEIAPIDANVRFLQSLPGDIPVALITRVQEDEVKLVMKRLGIPRPRFAALVCRTVKQISKAQMYGEAADRLGVCLPGCVAVENTAAGVAEARRARNADAKGIGLVIACPTPMTRVQDFRQADLVLSPDDPHRWERLTGHCAS